MIYPSLKGIALVMLAAVSSFAMSTLAQQAPTTSGPGVEPASMEQPAAKSAFPGEVSDFHGFTCHHFKLDGCSTYVVEPTRPLERKPWVWRTKFWGVYPEADIAALQAGLYVAYVEVGNTFGCPDAMKHFDSFYSAMTAQYGFSPKPALEGLSRGGLYAYRWACVNADKVGCIYGDAPVCDMKSWPGGKGKGTGSKADWAEAIKVYHFGSEQEMLNFPGNPIDTLAPLAEAHIPIIHVCGDADTAVPETENTDIVRERYQGLGGDFVLIVKLGCNHHPHGLANAKPVVDFILAHCATGEIAKNAMNAAPQPGDVIKLTKDQWLAATPEEKVRPPSEVAHPPVLPRSEPL